METQEKDEERPQSELLQTASPNESFIQTKIEKRFAVRRCKSTKCCNFLHFQRSDWVMGRSVVRDEMLIDSQPPALRRQRSVYIAILAISAPRRTESSLEPLNVHNQRREVD